MVGMCNFQDTFETFKRYFVNASSVRMTVPLRIENYKAQLQSLIVRISE